MTSFLKENAAQGIPELLELSVGRHHRENTEDGKMYLYDIVDIKKETSNPLGS